MGETFLIWVQPIVNNVAHITAQLRYEVFKGETCLTFLITDISCWLRWRWAFLSLINNASSSLLSEKWFCSHQLCCSIWYLLFWFGILRFSFIPCWSSTNNSSTLLYGGMFSSALVNNVTETFCQCIFKICFTASFWKLPGVDVFVRVGVVMIVILLFSVHLMISSCLLTVSFCVPLHLSAFLFVPPSVS